MAAIKEITTMEQWQSHVASLPKTTLLIIFFHAPWAAPCAQMSQVLQALAEDYAKPGFTTTETSWVSVNAEELSDVSETYDVIAVPYLVLQRNDQVLETVSGSNVAQVRKAIETHAPTQTTTAGSTEQKQMNGDAAPVLSTIDEGIATGKRDEAADPEEELKKRLTGLVSAATVMLFMKGTPSAPQCGFSRQLVNILRERTVRYGFFNILADDDVRQGLKKFADWPTYPQLWVSGELVGGLDIVKEELDNDPDFFNKVGAAPKVEAAQEAPLNTAA
ncbi:glutaredoxin [Hypoxylon sp. NC1633]|nr:glutaredoxin [Hypoxylon sp. NC1633]